MIFEGFLGLEILETMKIRRFLGGFFARVHLTVHHMHMATWTLS